MWALWVSGVCSPRSCPGHTQCSMAVSSVPLHAMACDHSLGPPLDLPLISNLLITKCACPFTWTPGSTMVPVCPSTFCAEFHVANGFSVYLFYLEVVDLPWPSCRVSVPHPPMLSVTSPKRTLLNSCLSSSKAGGPLHLQPADTPIPSSQIFG